MRTQLAFIGKNDLPGVEEDSRYCVENDFEGLEYNFWGDFDKLTLDRVEKMHGIHRAYGVRCTMLGLWGWNHLDPDPEKRTAANAMLERAVEFARVLEAEVLTMNAGRAVDDLDRNIAEFATVFGPVFEKLRAAGIRPAFYALHGTTFLDSIEAYEALWEHFPRAGIKFDPANWRHAGKDYIEVLRKHGDRVAYLHIKEHLYHNGELASQPPAGMGDIEWGKVFAFLYEHRYNGPLSIEAHGPIWSKGDMCRRMLLLTQRYITPFLI